ncbi:phosphoglycerate kinase, chloroplastic-like [Phalaenopsis equestris]|uniref:phosphoglycerate kinase, chloroplastic-like n=1 Tax=Phalaenopsis equestris TaxID=78828 RepID=UPI0009E283EB|nr:phosphoglycerate kinase, chloroplastic-like [Phalaenopsis equestris]
MHIGGGKLREKAAALLCLASICDVLIFVGMIAFQIMNASGIFVPSSFLEPDAFDEAAELIELANRRKIPIYFPTDLHCVNDGIPELFEIFPSRSLPPGWTPFDLGPVALKEINNFLSNCKKAFWIGPVKFASSENGAVGASQLARMLEIICNNGCDVTIVGNAVLQTVLATKCSLSQYKVFKNATVVWSLLEGKTLPGVAALDRAYPYEIVWATIYENPTQPLVVDIGSGNGLFPLKMAEKWKSLNFLGLEINNKLVMHCLDAIVDCKRTNVHFISTNATSTFRSIVSTYPGRLILVSIQCPNPDFNRKVNRWSMVQRALVDAIIDLLAAEAKVFLQSDIEDVTIRMKEQFIKYGKGKIVMDEDEEDDDDDELWLAENPFGVRTDWEQHVLDRGDLMYRTMLRKARDP